MWLRRSLFAAFIVFVGLSSVAVARDDKKPEDKKKQMLAWKLKEKDVIYQKMTTKTEQTMKVQNQEVKQTQTQTFYFSYTVKKEDAGTYTIVQKIEGVVMDIDIGGTKISYDSSKTDAAPNPLGEFFKALVGADFTLTVAPKEKDSKELKVTKIEGQADFIKRLGNANPQMAPLLNQILKEEALIEMAQPTFAALPGGEKTTGDNWKRSSTIDMGPIGKYENNFTYTYTGPDAKDAKMETIGVESALKYKEPTADGGVGGLPFKIKKANLKSDPAKGTIKYDPATGRIVSSTLDLKLDGDMEIEIGGQTTKVDLDQKQTTTIENSDKPQLEAKPK